MQAGSTFISEVVALAVCDATLWHRLSTLYLRQHWNELHEVLHFRFASSKFLLLSVQVLILCFLKIQINAVHSSTCAHRFNSLLLRDRQRHGRYISRYHIIFIIIIMFASVAAPLIGQVGIPLLQQGISGLGSLVGNIFSKEGRERLGGPIPVRPPARRGTVGGGPPTATQL